MHAEYFPLVEITDEVLEEQGEEFYPERPTSDGADSHLGRYYRYLDHGHVCLLDYMGNDNTVAASARISYGKGTKKVNNNSNLIARLMYDWHTSPFEQCSLRLHLKIPIFVMRQLVRHRTAKLNEYSARYSELSDEFYFPKLEELTTQSKTNKQGRSKEYDEEFAKMMTDLMTESYEKSHQVYRVGIDNNLSREIARLVMPVGGYTEVIWKLDLHNLFHLLRLRMDMHAQKEIRELAGLIANITKDWVPVCFMHFERIRLNGFYFSYDQLVQIAAALIDRKDVFTNLLDSVVKGRAENEASKKRGEGEVIPAYALYEYEKLSNFMIPLIEDVHEQMSLTPDMNFNPEEVA